MSKKYVEKLPHSCGTSRGLQVFLEDDGRYTGYCFSCHTHVKDPYAEKEEGYTPPRPSVKSPEQVQKELDAIKKFPCEALLDVGLKKATLEYFNVRLGYDQETASTVHAEYYPYEVKGEIKAYQVRVRPKRFFSLGDFDACEPFGWRQACTVGGYKLFITEGQKDAMSLFQVLRERGNSERIPAVISLHNGTKSVDKMSKHFKEFSKWKEIVLCFDNDEAGKEAVKRFTSMYPEAKVANLPLKDANEMLMAGREQELFNATVFESKTKLSDKLVRSSDVWDQARIRPKDGFSWPWPSLTNLTRGIRRGEGYYMGAGVKMGKSCLVNEIATHLIVEHDLTVFLCKPEEENAITAQKLAGCAVNSVFHDPKIEFDEEAFDRGKRLIDDKAIMYGQYGKISWEELKREIRYVCTVEGVKDIIIDPITCLTVGMGSGEANEKLIELASELASMSKELEFTYYVFCHLNKPASGKPHERGGQVLSVEFAGSRGMMRSAYYLIGLEGNKDPDQPELKNVRYLTLLEDRNFGETGKVPLFYNPNTGRLLEPTKDQEEVLNDAENKDQDQEQGTPRAKEETSEF